MKSFELNKPFFKKTVVLMLPIVLQQLITIGINFLDNLMVGGFGETQIAAAAFGNQFYSLFQFICMGLGSGAIVMSSQFWGRKELEPMRTVAAIALRVSFVFCAVFTAFSVAFPNLIMRIFTNEAAVVEAGTEYMRIIGLTFVMAGLSSTATYLLRSVGNVKVPLLGSAIAFVLNLFFNWVFIFGKLGAPRMEIVGAAVGTLIARAFEFVFVFGYFIFRDERFAFRLRNILLRSNSIRKQYVKYSMPVVISDTLLGLSITLSFVVVGHMGEEFSAASSIVNSVVQVSYALNMAMGGASAIAIGNTIGSGDIQKVKREGNSYMLISILFGLVLIPILLLLEKPYLGLYNVSGETLALCHGMLMVNCFFMPLQTNAYVSSKGILRGGGDTRFILLADSALVWLLSLPLGAIGGLVLGWNPIWVYAILRVEFPLKGVVCMIRYFTWKWIKEIRAEK
ncbi:MAG: MATE family efflux transporter [Ruminococcaceae bacterium]|nr:MATE family efflux transporter [Oscillospiraceae bacterium]